MSSARNSRTDSPRPHASWMRRGGSTLFCDIRSSIPPIGISIPPASHANTPPSSWRVDAHRSTCSDWPIQLGELIVGLRRVVVVLVALFVLGVSAGSAAGQDEARGIDPHQGESLVEVS